MKASFWASVVIAAALGFQAGSALAVDSVEQLRASGARVAADPKTGLTRFVGFDHQPEGSQPVNAALQQMPAEAAATQHLSSYARFFGLRDAASETRIVKHRVGKDGRSMTRYQQHHQGVPVIAGELIVNQTAQRGLTSISGKVSPELNLDTTPAIAAEQAKAIARTAMAKWYQLPDDEFVVPEPELSIYDARLMSPNEDPVVLVWRFDVTTRSLEPINEFIAVNAKTGGIALHFNQVPHAKNRITYDANSTTTMPGTVVCTESNPTCAGKIQDAVSAHVYAGKTYDFYATNFGRDSIDGAGMTMRSSVRYCQAGQCPLANAFWYNSQMLYGVNMSRAEDVVAHELTHGVTSYESKLFYYYQSGAINESLSDVFGELIQQSDPSGTVTPSTKWQLAEDLAPYGYPWGSYMRSMSNPPAKGNPDRMTSPYYSIDPSDSGGVHTNSGVNNKAAYLMVDGGSFNGRTVSALGLAKVARIYYEVQTNLLTSGSDYRDLYDALYQACQNLVGQSGIASADCQQVRNATDAVEMNLQPVAGYNPEAALCPSGQSVSNSLFSDSLESGGSNWLFAHTAGTVDWTLISEYASSGTNSLYGPDPDQNSLLSATMANGVTLPANAYLWFSHAFAFENSSSTYWDGGVLEYSTNGGSTWQDAGTLFSEGKNYGGTLSSGNPLGSRSAFVAESRGYVSSRYNLSTLAGQSARFRWRIGSDASVGALGWLVDNVKIHVCASGTTPTSPSAPTIGTAVAGNASINVAFTPGALGSGTLVNYTADCGGITATGSASPIMVSGLTNGTSYTCRVKVTTSVGTSAWSASSNAVTPIASDDGFPGGSIPPGWSTPGISNSSWIMSNDTAYAGTISLKSGVIGHNQKSDISYTASFAAGNVSFARKVSSEANYDYLEFYIDGVLKNRWSGEQAWAVVSFPITAGSHTLLWRYMKDGSVVSGGDAAWIDSVTLPAVMESIAGAQVVGAGDFNGDGKSDVLLFHPTNKWVAVWLMNGLTRTGSQVVGTFSIDGWDVVGTGDFNGDGKADILFYHPVNRNVGVWLMNGTTRTGAAIVGTFTFAGWVMVGAGDFNGDGKADILFHHPGNNVVGAWLMNGLSRIGGGTFP